MLRRATVVAFVMAAAVLVVVPAGAQPSPPPPTTSPTVTQPPPTTQPPPPTLPPPTVQPTSGTQPPTTIDSCPFSHDCPTTTLVTEPPPPSVLGVSVVRNDPVPVAGSTAPLARTGTDVLPSVAIGAGLTAAGTLLVLGARRRRNRHIGTGATT